MESSVAKLEEIMKPGQGYTWGQLMKSLGGNSSVTERMLENAVINGRLQEVKPIDGVNRSFRINQ